jgi:hypothetical protein
MLFEDQRLRQEVAQINLALALNISKIGLVQLGILRLEKAPKTGIGISRFGYKSKDIPAPSARLINGQSHERRSGNG